jgi:hypothetical protein
MKEFKVVLKGIEFKIVVDASENGSRIEVEVDGKKTEAYIYDDTSLKLCEVIKIGAKKVKCGGLILGEKMMKEIDEERERIYTEVKVKKEGHWKVWDYTNKSLDEVSYSNASDTATIEEIFEKETLDDEDEAEVFLIHAIDENGYNHDGELDALSYTIKRGYRYLDVDRSTKHAYSVKLIVEDVCYKNPDDYWDCLNLCVFYKGDDYYLDPNLRYYVTADEPLANLYDIEPNGGDALTYAEAVKLFNRIAECC